MKKMLVDDGIPFLPEEIIANILKRIPVKSLIRFQCVCKQWKNLLTTPSFIADHLHHPCHDDTPSILLQSNHRVDPLKLCFVDDKKRVRELQNPPLIDSLRGANVIGSSNSLLCVEFDEFDSWTEIEFENLKGTRLLHGTVTVNGTMFWHGSENLIVSFDIAKEEFRLIPMPWIFPEALTVLTVYENKLAMFYNNATLMRTKKNGASILWVMKEGTGASEERWS
ncbi:putative F-box protein At5g62060 [Neltuma alba]|uniref:putative F-box protein At5g62060 n=1 Tax=Neltuma alba TaxID=207710 RepID=UPI0010A54631|nr:putative F-box protein At5g62060 [Prosopis alba]